MKNLVIVLNRIFDILWTPLSSTPHYLDLVIISAISALIFLLIFKKASNQEMIRHYKNRMIAHIFEIRLYKDQPLQTLKSILKILWVNVIYLRYSLVPLTVIFIPFLVVSVQVNNRYGYSPLKANQAFIIRADLAKGFVQDVDNILQKIQYESSKGILLETPALRIQPEMKIFWRARVVNMEGKEQFIRLAVDGRGLAVEKKIVTSKGKGRFSPESTKWQTKSLFTGSAEDFIPEESSFEAVGLNYERAAYPFLAWNIDPIVLYFILTLIFGLTFKPILRVSI